MPKTDIIQFNIIELELIHELVMNKSGRNAVFTITATDTAYIIRATDGFLIGTISKTAKTDPDA